MFRFFQKIDWVLFFSVTLILGVSLLVLYSLSSSGGVDYFLRQLIFAGLGLMVLFFVATMDYHHIAKYSTALYFGTIALLLGVLLFGITVRGTAGWISLGVVQLQPVELAKVTLILFLASFISQKKSEFGEWTRVIASLILSAVLILLVLRQPDLGSGLVLASIWGGMILASGLKLRHFLVLFLLGATLATSGWFLLEPYQKDRIFNFVNPEADPQGTGYNVLQSIVAVGSGGFVGKGIGHGSQSQLNFLPEKHTDFIFAVVTEELGLVGAWLVLGLYLVLLYRIKRIGDESPDNFGYLLAVGVMTMLFTQITINIGMNMGLLPVTGLPAPLLSYGGSSILSVSLALGLLLSVYSRKRSVKDTRISLERSTLDF